MPHRCELRSVCRRPYTSTPTHPLWHPFTFPRLKNVNLAFLAWNAYPGGKNGAIGVAEFLVRAPTAITVTADVKTLHYSRAVRVTATSTIFGF